jgi:hypothetical protein
VLTVERTRELLYKSYRLDPSNNIHGYMLGMKIQDVVVYKRCMAYAVNSLRCCSLVPHQFYLLLPQGNCLSSSLADHLLHCHRAICDCDIAHVTRNKINRTSTLSHFKNMYLYLYVICPFGFVSL